MAANIGKLCVFSAAGCELDPSVCITYSALIGPLLRDQISGKWLRKGMAEREREMFWHLVVDRLKGQVYPDIIVHRFYII